MKKDSPLHKYCRKSSAPVKFVKVANDTAPPPPTQSDIALGTAGLHYDEEPWLSSDIPLVGGQSGTRVGGFGGAALGGGIGYLVNNWRKSREIEELVASGMSREEAEQVASTSPVSGAAIGAGLGGVTGYFGLPKLLRNNVGWAQNDLTQIGDVYNEQWGPNMSELKKNAPDMYGALKGNTGVQLGSRGANLRKLFGLDDVKPQGSGSGSTTGAGSGTP